MASTWAENNSGQRAEAERLEFDRLAIDIMRAQLKARKAAGAAAVDRAFHAKALLAVDEATVTFRSDLPKALAIGFAKPGESYRAIIRISNAANHAGPDYRPDLRAIADRIIVSADAQHDLLENDYPVAPDPALKDPEYLAKEAALRLAHGDIAFDLCIQRFVGEKVTPIEDTAVEWKESTSPSEPVATITIAKADVGSAAALACSRAVEGLSFNPWNTTDDFRPLGNLNRARKAAYDASAAHRLGMRWHADPLVRNRVLSAIARVFFRGVNRFVEWHKLPLRTSLLNLDVFRFVLRRDNLIDTNTPEAPPRARAVPPAPDEEGRTARSFDGRGNDMSVPNMGAVGVPFGRNVKPNYQPELFDTPNPITVSETLLKREAFIPARSLNILAAAWIQFQVHDWVDHARHALGQNDVRVPLPQ